MIVGIGVDVVDLARFRSALDRHGGRLEDRIFTADELRTCAARADRSTALAGRFAAKEACLKALGTGWASGIGFQQVEVRGGAPDPPRLVLNGPAAARAASLGVLSLHVSITHDGPVAVAVVVLEGDSPSGSFTPRPGA